MVIRGLVSSPATPWSTSQAACAVLCCALLSSPLSSLLPPPPPPQLPLSTASLSLSHTGAAPYLSALRTSGSTLPGGTVKKKKKKEKILRSPGTGVARFDFSVAAVFVCGKNVMGGVKVYQKKLKSDFLRSHQRLFCVMISFVSPSLCPGQCPYHD